MNRSTTYLFGAIIVLAMSACSTTKRTNGESTPAEIEAIQQLLPAVEVIPVAFLGSYHMSNPGADQFNLESDDVLAPKRQAEIREVVELLRRFNPTKIAIEAPRGDSLTLSRYQAYRNGERDLRRSEKEQIGFRLAKLLEHSDVYPIDVQMSLNSSEVSKLVESNPQRFGSYLSILQPIGNSVINTMDQWLKAGTIRDVLYKMNDPQFEHLAHEIYFRSFVPVVEEDNYAGADMITTWYQRNLRIFSNLHQISSPGDRILVIYGQGHMRLLKQFTEDSPYFEVEDILKYLK